MNIGFVTLIRLTVRKKQLNSQLKYFCDISNLGSTLTTGVRGSTVVEALWYKPERSRDRFPMVPLEFFIDIILPATLWPWGWLSLFQKWVPGIFPRGKGLKTLPPSCADCLKNLGASTSWNPQSLSRSVMGLVYLSLLQISTDSSSWLNSDKTQTI
jgi:hypothetical protein